ncbi:MAG: hypothetical protein EBS83_08425 [Planctomycetia bacterium]|nr:hypothetical protein [Planctomycetia bacterium]
MPLRERHFEAFFPARSPLRRYCQLPNLLPLRSAEAANCPWAQGGVVMSVPLTTIAELVSGRLVGPDTSNLAITSAATLETATSEAITLVDAHDRLPSLAKSQAAAAIVSPRGQPAGGGRSVGPAGR